MILVLLEIGNLQLWMVKPVNRIIRQCSKCGRVRQREEKRNGIALHSVKCIVGILFSLEPEGRGVRGVRGVR